MPGTLVRPLGVSVKGFPKTGLKNSELIHWLILSRVRMMVLLGSGERQEVGPYCREVGASLDVLPWHLPVLPAFCKYCLPRSGEQLLPHSHDHDALQEPTSLGYTAGGVGGSVIRTQRKQYTGFSCAFKTNPYLAVWWKLLLNWWDICLSNTCFLSLLKTLANVPGHAPYAFTHQPVQHSCLWPRVALLLD